MAERYVPTREEIVPLMQGVKPDIKESDITEVYAVYKNTRVFRTDDRVYKIRMTETFTQELAAEKELNNFNALMSYYRLHGIDFGSATLTPSGKRGILCMPYLGENLVNVKIAMEMFEMGYSDDQPAVMQTDDLVRLMDRFKLHQAHFASVSGLVHNDLAQAGAPNNLVYNPAYNMIMPVDAEAFTEYSPQSGQRFLEQVSTVQGWLL